MKKKIIYIITCNIFDPSRKKVIIAKIKLKGRKIKFCKKYIILRFPEIIGKNNNPILYQILFITKLNSRKPLIYGMELKEI